MKTKTLLARIALLVSLLLVIFPASADTNVVTAVNSEGWVITPADGTNTPTISTFVNNPQLAPPLGSGAYRTRLEGSNQKTTFKRSDYTGTLLSDLTVFTYSHFVASAQLNSYYVNFYVNIDTLGDTDADHEMRLDMQLPPATPGVWATVDALTTPYVFALRGGFTTTLSGVVTIADVIAAHPDAEIGLAFGQANNGGLRLNIGDTATTYVGFDGYLDNVNITANGIAETWDFEGDVPANAESELIVNGSFETVNPGDAKGAANWKGAITNKAKRVCTLAVEGACSYYIKAGAAATIRQKVAASTVEVGDLLRFSAAFEGKGISAGNVSAYVQVKYAGGQKFKAPLVVPSGTFTFTYDDTSLGIFGDVTKIDVYFSAATGAGKLWIDDVSLILEKDGLRAAAPEGVLPLPMPASK